MIEPRLYRAAFVPAVLAAVFVMFSFEDRPPPLPQGLAADVLFDEQPATEAAERLARARPDRRAGTPGNHATARMVAEGFRERGFETSEDRFSEGGRDMVNVVGRRAGASREQVVIMAPRDAASRPDRRGSAADTAALLEMARVIGGRSVRKTLVLVSVDGSTVGAAGARRFLETAEDPDRIDAVLTMSSLGAPDRGEPVLIGWSNDVSREPVGLARTAAASLAREVGSPPDQGGLLTQFSRLAVPVAVGEQGVLLERGVEAIRFSGSGELPNPNPGGPIDRQRLGGLGRAVLRTAAAIDRGPLPSSGPASYLGVSRKLIPGWAVSLLVLSLILPALVAAIDAFARAKRRRQPVLRGALWVLAAALPFAVGLAVTELLVLFGQAPDAPPAPLVPGVESLETRGGAALVVTAVATALAAVFARPLVLRGWGRRRDRRRLEAAARNVRQRSAARADNPEAGPAAALALVLSATVLLVWFLNPFTALLLVPALHLWTLGALTEVAGRGRVATALLAGGLVLPLAAVVLTLNRLSLDPLEGAWYFFLLLTGHQIGLAGALIGCALLGSLGCFGAIALAKVRRGPAEGGDVAPIRGPATYAGPGSLGGTESALNR